MCHSIPELELLPVPQISFCGPWSEHPSGPSGDMAEADFAQLSVIAIERLAGLTGLTSVVLATRGAASFGSAHRPGGAGAVFFNTGRTRGRSASSWFYVAQARYLEILLSWPLH